MSNKSNNQKVSKLRSVIIRNPAVCVAIFWGLSMFIIFNVISLLKAKSFEEFLLLVSLNGLVWTLGGLAYRKLLQRKIIKREEQFGLILSGEDRLKLFKWYKYGQIPTDWHLQPMLRGYVELLESNAKGNSFVRNKQEKIICLAIFVFFFIINLFITISAFSLGNLFSLLFFMLLLAMVIGSNPGKTNPLFERLNHRLLKNINRMRNQLKQAHTL